MTHEHLRSLLFEYATDIDFLGHPDSDGNLRHCGRGDCGACPFGYEHLCFLYEAHNPTITPILASIRTTNPEFFI